MITRGCIPHFVNCYGFHTVHGRSLPAEHDPSDRHAALRYAMDTSKMYTGIFYQQDRPTLDSSALEYREAALKKNAEKPTPLMNIYQRMGGTVPVA